MPTIAEALRDGARMIQHSETPLLDARILLKFVLNMDDAELIARSEEILCKEDAEIFEGFLKRRAASEPVAYIIGEKEFWSLPFKVTKDVLIPRADSECLIETALARRDKHEKLHILDLGVGSGCLLCALLLEFPNSRGVGVDRAQQAAQIARRNARALALDSRIELIVGDWFKPIEGQFDLIVANPPYIPAAATLPEDVVKHEPSGALFAGEDGMDAYRAILTDAPKALKPDGLLLFEMGDSQGDALTGMVSEAFPKTEIFPIFDLKGRKRGLGADGRR